VVEVFILIMRHGRAVEAGSGMSDEERPLSGEGVEEVVVVSRLLPRVRIVYSSPLRRAVETAEIVARAHRAEYRVVDELLPGRYLKDVEPYFADRALFVGHAPYVEDYVAELSGYRPRLPTAGVVGLRKVEKVWLVEFFLTPQYAREVIERLPSHGKASSQAPQCSRPPS
jgi:phosphohistidine phosphatase SixA